MKKVNFLEVYHNDSASEEKIKDYSKKYHKSAEEAFERSELTLEIISSSNPNISMEWKFSAMANDDGNI